MTSDVLSLIRNNLDGFSKRQRAIAHFIMDNYDKAAFMTASVWERRSMSVNRRWCVLLRNWGTKDIPKCSGRCRK